MRYFDFHVHSAFSGGKSSIEQLAFTAKELGYSGICFAEYFKNDAQLDELKVEIAKVSGSVGIEIYLGFEARNVKELHKLVERRRLYDVLLVQGGDLKLNRIACETPQVDILTHPENNRMDSGLNHILVKAAAKNNVAIEINFRGLLLSSKKTRSMIMRHISQNVKLAKKFHAPLILCSGAVSTWELRSPEVLISMANQIGLEIKDSKDIISKIPTNIIKQIEERSPKNWISPGIKIIE